MLEIKLTDKVDFDGKATKKPIPIEYKQINEPFKVQTLEHENGYLAKAEDYLIKVVDGEYYSCDKDIFERTYNKL